jgi:hypothetical protein
MSFEGKIRKGEGEKGVIVRKNGRKDEEEGRRKKKRKLEVKG